MLNRTVLAYFYGLVMTFFCPLFGFGQTSGQYFTQNFSSEEYQGSAQNWAITQDSLGRVFVGNNDGVLLYDGVKWKTIDIPNNTPVRSLITAPDGTIYVGAVGELGCLEIDSKGFLRFNSLTALIDSAYTFSEVWSICAIKENVFFVTDSYVFRYDGRKISAYPKKGKFYFLGFVSNGEFMVFDVNEGFRIWNGRDLVTVVSEELAAVEEVFAVIPFAKNISLVGTRTDGFFLYNHQSKKFSRYAQFDHLRDFVDLGLYFGCRLSDGNLLLSTKTKGAIIVNTKGVVLEYINELTGLADSKVYTAYEDLHNNLWLGLGNGIAFVEYASPFRSFGKLDGIQGSIYSIKRLGDAIFVGTGSGIFSYRNEHWHKFDEVWGQSWDLEKLVFYNKNDKPDSVMFAATGLGLKWYDGAKWNTVPGVKICFDISNWPINRNMYAVACEGGLGLLYMEKGKFGFRYLKRLQADLRYIAKGNQGKLWAATTNTTKVFLLDVEIDSLQHGFKSAKCSTVLEFTVKDGLPKNTTIKLVGTKHGTRFLTEKGSIRFDTLSSRFRLDPFLKQYGIADTTEIFPYSESPSGEIIYCSGSRPTNNIALLSGGKVMSSSFRRFQNVEYLVYFFDGDQIWMGGPMGIHVYHKKKGLGFESTQFRALITEILVGQDRVVYDGNGAASFKQHTLLYEQNNLTLSFSSDFYAADSKCAYRYQLVGADEQWSPWTENAKKEYTKLEEGEYTFRLQAKNVYGDLSATSELQFTVLPPWYRTFGAYLLYVFVFAVFVAMVLRMLTASLRWQKVRLENIVSERTWEIAQKSNEISSKNTELELQQSMILQQKENLELLNTELVRSNNAIRHSQGKMHDSLNYAQRIQMAMMPDDVLLNTLFKDFFVMWTPRDVVSGDFYMIRKLFIKGEMLKIIMVADCTGHGVPGAFVSMLGIAFLNEIIVDSMLWRCPKPAAEILEIMRVKIKSSLKQSVHGSGMKDGMDMSICIIREERAMVEFAGANSPIFLVRDALEDFSDLPSSARWLTSKDLNLVHLIPNKQPLGIYMKEYQFTSTTFTLKPNDRFYLFSDGFADQLGGEFQRKFQMNQFKQLILENAHLPMPAQQQVLTDTLKRWIANDYRQVDDILVVGIHL